MNWPWQSRFFRSRNLLHWLINLVLLAAATRSATAQALNKWQIDPKSSVAILSLGSGADMLQVGLARVSGEVAFESSDPADLTVAFNLSSGNDTGPEYASMSFVSRSCATTADGKLIVAGDLSITRVERSITMDPNEAYAGPRYGDPVAHTDTRPITLVFSGPGRLNSQGGMKRFSGTSTVVREEFPQLLDAITVDAWPSQLINDQKCTSPSPIGEDYRGSECTGTVIARVNNAVVSTGASSGEGFYGFVPLVTPNRDKATIALDLTLKQVPGSPIASR